MRNGHTGKSVKYAVAIVDYENGSVACVAASDIVFKDTRKVIDDLERKFTNWITQNDIIPTFRFRN